MRKKSSIYQEEEKRRLKKMRQQKSQNEMEEINTTISVFIVHLNKLNALVKNKMIISPDLNTNLAM